MLRNEMLVMTSTVEQYQILYVEHCRKYVALHPAHRTVRWRRRFPFQADTFFM